VCTHIAIVIGASQRSKKKKKNQKSNLKTLGQRDIKFFLLQNVLSPP
jgi:hypothetical protein